MGFQPAVREHLQLSGYRYTIGEHPHAPGIPYGQEGRQGTVYMLQADERSGKKAMKVFRGRFVDPSLVQQTRQLAQYAQIAGLSACNRMIVTPQNSQETLRTYPELLYAVVMAWIEGPTWTDVLLDKRRLSMRHSHQAAYSLVQTLAEMEQQGLAHCDLSAPNVMLPMLGGMRSAVRTADDVQLIDLEQMFAPQLERPDYAPGGSPGYAPTLHAKSLGWHAHADRFAGAVLIMEMLGACAPGFAGMAWGESYFAPEELQTDCERYRGLVAEARTIWGAGVADLFARAWDSGAQEQCPTFGEWLIELAKLERRAAVQGGVQQDDAQQDDVRHDDARRDSTQRDSAQQGNAMRDRAQQDDAQRDSTWQDSAKLGSAQLESAVGLSIHGKAGEPSVAHMLEQASRLESQRRYGEAIALYRTIQAGPAHYSLAKEVEIAISELEQQQRSEQSKLEQRRIRRKRIMKRTLLTGILVTAVALIGGAGYSFLFKHNGLSSLLSNRTAYEAEIQSLQQTIAAKDEHIDALLGQLQEKRLPPGEQTELLMGRLAEYFAQIRELSESEMWDRTSLPQAVFNESESYMAKLFDYMESGMGLDPYTLEQSRIVAAYYYTFLYNNERNEQLNIRYFEDYRNKFLGGDEP